MPIALDVSSMVASQMLKPLSYYASDDLFEDLPSGNSSFFGVVVLLLFDGALISGLAVGRLVI